jgi:hypothetical protein
MRSQCSGPITCWFELDEMGWLSWIKLRFTWIICFTASCCTSCLTHTHRIYASVLPTTDYNSISWFTPKLMFMKNCTSTIYTYDFSVMKLVRQICPSRWPYFVYSWWREESLEYYYWKRVIFVQDIFLAVSFELSDNLTGCTVYLLDCLYDPSILWGPA